NTNYFSHPTLHKNFLKGQFGLFFIQKQPKNTLKIPAAKLSDRTGTHCQVQGFPTNKIVD
ncbi:MAG: hypothetical protein ACO21S_01065, partial [Sediminibacterium sp.]